MHLKFRGNLFTNTLDLTTELLNNGVIIANFPNMDFMKASLLCFVENLRTHLNIPDLEPSGYVIVNPFIEFPAHFGKLPKEEQVVLIGWMAFFLKYIDHAVKKEYFLSECVNELMQKPFLNMLAGGCAGHMSSGQLELGGMRRE
nr:hypothetical protein HmN_000128000 [Hymenolepis microstoma]